MCACMHVCVYLCMHAFMHACKCTLAYMHDCMQVYMCVCMHCVYLHTNIHTFLHSFNFSLETVEEKEILQGSKCLREKVLGGNVPCPLQKEWECPGGENVWEENTSYTRKPWSTKTLCLSSSRHEKVENFYDIIFSTYNIITKTRVKLWKRAVTNISKFDIYSITSDSANIII